MTDRHAAVDDETRHRADFLRRMLQLSSGLEAHRGPETEVDESLRER
jgi:hypothetical protein